MSRQQMIVLLAVGLLTLGGWALAQQERPEAKAPTTGSGPYVVSPAGDSAVLLDTKSGASWVLHRSVEGDSVWLPAKRINSEEQALRWQKEEVMRWEERENRVKRQKREEEFQREQELKLKKGEKH